jgi:molybdenum cofactor synthesis domain-containing protein
MVVIGNEILSGKVVDGNSGLLARELRELGVSLDRVVVIPDDTEIIADTVARYSAEFDVVFTSGGVGPTHDDITIGAVASAFDREVVIHPELRQLIDGWIDGELTPAHLKMAEVPAGAELVADEHFRFPTVMIENVYVLPGIPEIFKAKVAGLRDRLRGQPWHLRQVYVSSDEAAIAPSLDATLEAFSELLLGSYPRLDRSEYSVKLTLESRDEQYVDAALDDLVGRLPAGSVLRVER